MQEERYTGNDVIERGYAIYDEWNNKKYRSRQIVKLVENAIADTNAKMTHSSHVAALAHLFALDLRIKGRYGSLIKCIIFYLSWKRETSALNRFKALLKMPDVNDIRDIIEVELERLRQNIDGDASDENDKKRRGGNVTEMSGDEATVSWDEMQSDDTAEEKLEESLGNEKNEENAENTEEIEKIEKIEDSGEEKPIEEQKSEIAKESAEGKGRERTSEYVKDEPEAKTHDKSEESSSEKKTDKDKEPLSKNKIENNGTQDKSEPSINKKAENIAGDGVIDALIIAEEAVEEKSKSRISFIDEVIMDNMIKGERDIIGHNPLKTVKLESGEHTQVPEIFIAEKVNDGDRDAHLYDKMVLNFNGAGLHDTSNSPLDKALANVQDKLDENRVQINVQENLNEENAVERSVNDKFTEKMINTHKSLMENALREELMIDGDEIGIKESVRMIEEGNAAPSAQVKKY